jgi:AcrR family transcriptional regulator
MISCYSTNMNIKPDADAAKRRYQMKARAATTAATRERIIDAAIALFWEQPWMETSLEDVARRAGVSLPTVIRHYGDRQGLFAAAGEREFERVRVQREEAPVGDVREAVRVLFDHYEELGDSVMRLLAEEDRVPALRPIADRGRDYHEQWCERVFAPFMSKFKGEERVRWLTQCIAVTDVLVWKLMRRDRGLSRQQAELAVCELLERLIGGQ